VTVGGVFFNFVYSTTIMKYRLQPPGIGHHVLRNVWTFLRNVKVKFTLEQATKAQSASRGIALLFLEPRR